MAITITKLEKGGIEFDYGTSKNYRSKMTNVAISKDIMQSNIIISYTDGVLNIPYAELTDINGAPKPNTIELAMDKLAKEVFTDGGGTGEGVQWSDVSWQPDGFKVAQFSEQGLPSTGEALFPENCVPLYQVNYLIEDFSQDLIKINTTSFPDPPTSSAMNALYPDARVRTTVYLENVNGSMLKYTKLNATDWEAQPYTIA